MPQTGLIVFVLVGVEVLISEAASLSCYRYGAVTDHRMRLSSSLKRGIFISGLYSALLTIRR